MKVLHIANWYPTPDEEKRALWIRDQIRLLDGLEDYEVWHLEVVFGKRMRLNTDSLSPNEHSLTLSVPTRKWFLIEAFSLIVLCYLFLFKVRLRDYTHIHFHIAYPLLTYWHLLRKWISKPVILSEHWSAYHFHFNVPNRDKLGRIKRIFRNPMHLVTVSNALAEDIMHFSGNDRILHTVIPNVIDKGIFYYAPATEIQPGTLLMVSQWKAPKDPFVIFHALRKTEGLRLRVAGYGDQLEAMQELVQELGLEDRVLFLGPLTRVQIAREMQRCVAFVHSSHYETFSVVCAEAICCGCPVVASAVGGIPEFIDSSNGILVRDQSMASWERALSEITTTVIHDRERISHEAHRRFDEAKMKEALHSVYRKNLF